MHLAIVAHAIHRRVKHVLDEALRIDSDTRGHDAVWSDGHCKLRPGKHNWGLALASMAPTHDPTFSTKVRKNDGHSTASKRQKTCPQRASRGQSAATTKCHGLNPSGGTSSTWQ
eukprot:1862100-Prymnesium_polylepis.1